MKPGQALRAMRPIKSYACQQCGKVFKASDARAKFCSNACRQRAKYERAKTKHRPAPESCLCDRPTFEVPPQRTPD